VDDLGSRYDEEGWARVRGAFPAAAAAAMAEAVWETLTRRDGIRPDDPSTWTVTEPRGLAGLRERGAFDALGSRAVVDAVTALLGRSDWLRPADWGGALVTFPTPGSWAVPRSGWHLDWPARGAPGSRLLVKWLGYATPIGRGGGGTVALAGSHRLVAEHLARTDPDDPGRSRAVRDAVFRRGPWFRDLPPDRGTTVGGVPVRVVELTGEPGDVVFLHPHLLHAAAPNRAGAPRFMVTGQVLDLG
jgi:Phytanoyl-CoA dioxygenase (PhyH)